MDKVNANDLFGKVIIQLGKIQAETEVVKEILVEKGLIEERDFEVRVMHKLKDKTLEITNQFLDRSYSSEEFFELGKETNKEE